MKNRKEKYLQFLMDAKALLQKQDDIISNLANFSALHRNHFDAHWVGFYLVKKNKLTLGPFQGPVACTNIKFNQGVCGASYIKKETIIVPDVHKYEGHIACSGLTNSEIVVPLVKNGKCWALLDVDSLDFDTFNEVDKEYLEQAVSILNFN